MPQWRLVAQALNVTQQTFRNGAALFLLQKLSTAKLFTHLLPQFFIWVTVAHSIVITVHTNTNLSKTLWCEVVELDVVCEHRKCNCYNT